MAEKFTRWADKSTGINPFLLDSIRYPSNNLVEKIIYYGKILLIAIPRILLASLLLSIFILNYFLIFELTSFILSLLYLQYSHANGTTLVPAGVILFLSILSMLPRPFSLPFIFFKQMFNIFLIKASAYLIGVSYEVSLANTFRVVGVRAKASSNPNTLSTVLPGEIIISNLCSVLEIFVYQAYCTPLFVFPLLDSSGTSLCVGLSFLSAISYTLNLSNNKKSLTGEPLVVLLQKSLKSNRPIVLFIEGTITNGTGILEFPSKIFENVNTIPKIHLSGITYSPSSSSREITATSPTCPIGSHLERFLWLSSQLSIPQGGGITFLSAEFIPPCDMKRGINEQVLNKWIDELRIIFSKLVNKKLLKLSLQDYHSFANYYNALKSGKSEEAKSLADSRGK